VSDYALIFFVILNLYKNVMKFEVCILGSSAATPGVKRNLTAQTLNIRENFMLIDCGESTQIQMRRHKQSFQKLSYIFISHLHGDHCWGLPGLLSSMHLLGRKNTLEIFSPKGVKNWINLQLSLSETRLEFEVIYHELKEKTSQLILDHPVFEVYTLPLKHRIYCNGFLFREKIKNRKMKIGVVEKFKIPHFLSDVSVHYDCFIIRLLSFSNDKTYKFMTFKRFEPQIFY
jgi:ribonuclease Z